jgi:hypothetical protein
MHLHTTLSQCEVYAIIFRRGRRGATTVLMFAEEITGVMPFKIGQSLDDGFRR